MLESERFETQQYKQMETARVARAIDRGIQSP